MTRPTLFFLGPDGGDEEHSKIYLRTLFYSTSKRGLVIENIFVRLRRGESTQNFNIWVYGEKDLFRGSGLYVGPEGIASNHHFLTPKDTGKFEFRTGQYRLEVFAKVVGRRMTKLLTSIDFQISDGDAVKLKKPGNGIYFDWGPDSESYHSHVDAKPRRFQELEALHYFAEKLRGDEQK